MSRDLILFSGMPVESFRARCRSTSCAETAAVGGGKRAATLALAVAGRYPGVAPSSRVPPSDPRLPPSDPRVECPMEVAVLAAVPGRCSTGTEAEGRRAATGVEEGRVALAEEEGRAARQEGLEVAGRRGLAPEETGRRGLDPPEGTLAGRREVHPEEGQSEAAVAAAAAAGEVSIVTTGS